jgi:6-phosphogluconolactonase
MEVTRYNSTDDFVRAAAQWIASELHQLLEKQEHVTLGLSGGSTPQPVYTLLAANRNIAWDRVSVFLVDERYTPADAADSNQGMIHQALLIGAGANAASIFPDTSKPVDECVQQYDQLIAKITPDIVILGMGDDGHIASLFPPLGAAAFGPSTVIHTTTDRFAVHDRISTTLPFLLKAKKRLFLISGEKKNTLLKKMQSEMEDASLYPAQYLFDDRTTWMVGV